MTSFSQPSPTVARRLFLFSSLLVAAAIGLIMVGAQVTSKGAGMSVPDWPTTYGYNLYTFPFKRWLGPDFWQNPVFWEHSHRILASVIGFLTIGLAAAICALDPRRWMRGVGLAAVVLVCLQGLAGGIRVIAAQDSIGIIHGTLAQLFLVLAGFIALTYTRGWLVPPPNGERLPRRWQRGIHFFAGLIFVQLLLGAVMRHHHTWLSIPDFPTAYGTVWPHVDADRLAAINAERAAANIPPTTLVQIYLQMAHRILAVVIFFGILVCSLAIFRCRKAPAHLRKLATLWLVLVTLQIALGSATILTGKSPVIASAHVVTGALLLLVGSHMAALVSRWRRSPGAAATALAETPAIS